MTISQKNRREELVPSIPPVKQTLLPQEDGLQYDEMHNQEVLGGEKEKSLFSALPLINANNVCHPAGIVQPNNPCSNQIT